MSRLICLVIDGLGIGQMEDVPRVRPADTGANTLLHVAQSAGGLSLPFLRSLGLGNVAPAPGVEPIGSDARAGYGRMLLRHVGADTFWGHQELMGSAPEPPIKQLLKDLGPLVRQHLEAATYTVEELTPGAPCLLVNGAAVVADAMETEPGENIMVTGCVDYIPFGELVAVGEKVREVVDVGRVVVVASRGFTIDDVISHLRYGPEGNVGPHQAGLGIFGENYEVRHLGKGVRLEGQAPTRVAKSGVPVSLLGKAADVVKCEGAHRAVAVDSETVFGLIHARAAASSDWLIVANVQETDLAGHQQDVARWVKVLGIVDREAERLPSLLGEDGMLIIAGDHGNDPTIGHSRHTRELTPLLVYSPAYEPGDLGLRETLADVGASIVDFFHAGTTEAGRSVLAELGPSLR